MKGESPLFMTNTWRLEKVVEVGGDEEEKKKWRRGR